MRELPLGYHISISEQLISAQSSQVLVLGYFPPHSYLISSFSPLTAPINDGSSKTSRAAAFDEPPSTKSMRDEKEEINSEIY